MLAGGIVVMCLGAVFVWGGIVALRRSGYLARSGVQAHGIISSIHHSTAAGPNGTTHTTSRPVVTFSTADGERVSATVEWGGGPGQVGAEVDVLYDPRNPKHAEMDTPRGRSPFNAVFLLFVGVAFFLWGLLLAF